MPRHIKALLEPYLQSKNSNWKITLLKEWSKIMGKLAHNVTIIKIYDTTIILGVYDSCWLQEMYLLSPMIQKTINQNLDRPRIKQIRFKHVGRPQKKSVPPPEKKEVPIAIALTDREKTALDTIENEHLKDVLQSFLMRCYRERKK